MLFKLDSRYFAGRNDSSLYYTHKNTAQTSHHNRSKIYQNTPFSNKVINNIEDDERRRRRGSGETVIFISSQGSDQEVEASRAKFTWPCSALVLGLVFFSYNTTSLAPPAMAASDGLSSAIFQ